MAYDKKSGGCTPITAKIKRTTQGGMITQPILNMGAPVKIKSNPKNKITTYLKYSFIYLSLIFWYIGDSMLSHCGIFA